MEVGPLSWALTFRSHLHRRSSDGLPHEGY